MARHTLTTAEINTLLAQTVSTLTREDLQNLEDALNKKVCPPTQTLGATLP